MKTAAVVFILVGLAGVAATGAVAWATIPTIEAAWASAEWPTTDGVVVEMSSSRHSGTHVLYRYEVAGRAYESRQVRLVEKFIADSRMERAALYPDSARVTVWYDPAAPERAVLEPGTTRAAVAKKFGAAGIILLLSLGLVYVGVHGLRSHR